MSDSFRDLAFSPNVAEEKRNLLEKIFPEAMTEGKLDIAALKRVLGEQMVVEGGERYAMTWAGKSDAFKVLQVPTSSTLRPQPEQSVEFDEAGHIFIEGENLEVLKVLQKAYFGKVKLIYIDPPYNTGSDAFIYPDRFQESKEDYLKRINELHDDGTLMRAGLFRKNTRENGHFHSNWLSMMLPRLYIARDLLREDGLVFVSCDDNEVHNLRLLMDEVFDEANFISQIIVQSNKRGQTYKDVAKTHEYLLVYARSDEATLYELPKESDALPYEDANGRYDLWELRNRNPKFGKHNRPNLFFPIYVSPAQVDADGYARVSLELVDEHSIAVVPQNSEGRDGCWRWSDKKILTDGQLEEDLPVIVAKQRRDGHWNIYEKSRKSTTKPKSLWTETEVISEQGTMQLGELGMSGYFDHPKPRGLIEKVVQIATEADDLILDFFSGSATTFDAVARLNWQEKTEREVICVQLRQDLKEDTPAFRDGYRTIADIARERMRRVIAKINEEADVNNPAPQHLGFKSYELAPSNFKQWRGDWIETEEQLSEQLALFVEPEKNGARTEDILVELLLKNGQPLTTAIEKLELQGILVYAVNNRSMLFLLDAISEDVIDQVMELNPQHIFTLDSVFYQNDVLKTNLDLQCQAAKVRFTCV